TAPGWGWRSARPSCTSTRAASRSRAARDAARPSCSTSRWRNAMAKGESPTHVQTPHTLLVVDDERSLRFTIGEWARDLGFTPLEAAAGSEALERVREQAVDVVLLDLRLTNEDGMEVLKKLRDEDPSL